MCCLVEGAVALFAWKYIRFPGLEPTLRSKMFQHIACDPSLTRNDHFTVVTKLCSHLSLWNEATLTFFSLFIFSSERMHTHCFVMRVPNEAPSIISPALYVNVGGNLCTWRNTLYSTDWSNWSWKNGQNLNIIILNTLRRNALNITWTFLHSHEVIEILIL